MMHLPRPSFRAVLYAIFLTFLSGLPASALVWVERHGMSGASLQSEYDHWTAAPFRYRMTRLCGSESAGSARYTAIFQETTSTTHTAARNGMTATDFLNYHNSIHAVGYRLVWLDGFGVGANAYYNGLWELTNGASQRVRLGETVGAHITADSNYNDDNYYLTDVSSFSVNGVPQHAGVWTFGRLPTLQVEYSMTGAQYQTEFDGKQNAGYHLYRANGYLSGANQLYTGVWRNSSYGEGWSRHGMSSLAFTAEMNNAQTLGYRPVFIEPWNDADGDTFYNATWVRNGGLSMTRLGQISTAVQSYMSARNLPGLSLAIAREGRLVYARGFGYADTATGEAAHSQHRWRIASTSKPVCAVAALRALEDSSAWSLDSKAFGSGALFGTDFGSGSYSTWERAITLRQLMNMTCGWQGQGKLWYYDEPAYGTNHDLIMGYQLDSVSVVMEPGTSYCYNNTNYQAAARIPEKITGKTFEQYTAEEVFQPCGITSMVLGGRTAAAQLSGEVSYYAGNVYGDPETVWPARMDGSTGWITKPSDLLLLARRIDGNSRHRDIIGSYALSQMQMGNGQIDFHNGGTSGYGLGWYPGNRNGQTWWQHNGSMAGTQAILCVSDDGGMSFAYATNSVHDSDAFSSTFRNTILDLMDDIDDADAWPAVDFSGKYNPEYDAWAAGAFGTLVTSRSGTIPVWAPENDPDDDGRSNALEAYLGSDPLAANANPFTVTVSGGKLRMRWLRANGYRGVEAAPQWSSSLQTWSSSGADIETPGGLFVPIGYQWQEATVSSSAARRYLRLSLAVP